MQIHRGLEKNKARVTVQQRGKHHTFTEAGSNPRTHFSSPLVFTLQFQHQHSWADSVLSRAVSVFKCCESSKGQLESFHLQAVVQCLDNAYQSFLKAAIKV